MKQISGNSSVLCSILDSRNRLITMTLQRYERASRTRVQCIVLSSSILPIPERFFCVICSVIYLLSLLCYLMWLNQNNLRDSLRSTSNALY